MADAHPHPPANWPLLAEGAIVLDYVITHEICHLKHPNYGPQFHRMLTSLMPDWKKLKERLEHLI